MIMRITLLLSVCSFVLGAAAALELPTIFTDFENYSRMDCVLLFVPSALLSVPAVCTLVFAVIIAAGAAEDQSLACERRLRIRVPRNAILVALASWFVAAMCLLPCYRRVLYRHSVETRGALCNAARHGDIRTMRIYLDRGADPNSFDPNSDEGSNVFETALTVAIYARHTESVTLLLQKGASVDKVGGLLLPLQAAADCGDVGIGRLLVDYGADVNSSLGGESPLIVAVRAGNAAFVRFLLESGADVSRRDASGKTASKLAREKRSSEMLGILVAAEKRRAAN